MDQETIRKQAKEIMDAFIKTLDASDLPAAEIGVERSLNTRKATTEPQDASFKDRMLANAPKVNNDCIVAEKKSW